MGRERDLGVTGISNDTETLGSGNDSVVLPSDRASDDGPHGERCILGLNDLGNTVAVEWLVDLKSCNVGLSVSHSAAQVY